MRDLIYKPIRPQTSIEIASNAKLGNCYCGTTYRITSTLKLKRGAIEALADAGFLGYGQEFRILSRCDGHEPAAGHDTVRCVATERGEVVDENPINEYSGKPHPTIEMPFYVYDCERRVDSSD